MSLEEVMTKLTVALEANTKAFLASRGATGGGGNGGTTTITKPPKGPTLDDLKAAAVRVADAKGKPFAKKIIKDVGKAAELAAVKPENFPALIAAFEKALSPDTVDDDGDEGDDGL